MNGDRLLPDGERAAGPKGTYWRDQRGVWMCVTPAGHLGDLSNHDVTEHTDGTITVSPSILVSASFNGRREGWHGYLEHGVWREC
jgi:hypothetical protein